VKIPPSGVPLEEIERSALMEALKMSNWVQKDAAELLGISPRVMNYKIKTLRHRVSRAAAARWCAQRRNGYLNTGPNHRDSWFQPKRSRLFCTQSPLGDWLPTEKLCDFVSGGSCEHVFRAGWDFL
jgi:hypothetical protein